ncbi:hypothetical protein [Mesorhizobium sp. KR1-2]|uniref:hypothetical protein n=1 Tax=Mesorhizobium sp. KR1-2 TaxID=3156609 RepID=UPI0032B43559
MAKSTFPRPSDRMQNPQVVYSRIGEVKCSETRNALRGIVSRRKQKLDASEINLIRAQASTGDLALAIEILLGKRGSMPFSNLNGKYRNLLARHGLDPISPPREVQFAIGRINGWPANAIEVIGSIMSLAPLPQADVNDALNALQVFADRWGASNYLARKLAYVISREDEQIESHPAFEAISQIVEHQKFSLPYFTALESIDPRFPYFTGMNTRLLLLKKYVADDDDFRQWLPLHNIAPCPMSENDIGAFIRKAHSMSFVDEVIALLQVYYLRDHWEVLGDAIQRALRPEILAAFSKIESLEFDCRLLFARAEPDSSDFTYYRNALAFLEFVEPTRC